MQIKRIAMTLRQDFDKLSRAAQGAVVTVVVALILLLAASYTTAAPPVEEGELSVLASLSTTFTYQGRLTDGGSPANGTYDLQFELYDAASDGTLIGTITVGDVTVTDGLFTVELDFGSGIFTGDARYLEIGVRPGDSSGAYTTLSPRQALTAAPYALYAQRVAAHDHLGQTWTGSDNSLVINGAFGAPDYAPLVLSNSDSNGLGLRVDSAGEDGVLVGSAGGNGVSVGSTGNDGVYVALAGDDGVSVYLADDDGVRVSSAGGDGVSVGSAGNPSTTSASTEHNGFEVAGAEGNGLSVGRSDGDGVYVASAGDDGLHVDGASDNGVAVATAMNNGMYVYSAGSDGVSVRSAGNPSATNASTDEHNGFEVAGAEAHGLYVGRADKDGVYVHSAGDDGMFVYAPDDDGVSVFWAGDDGAHVFKAGNPSATRSSDLHDGFEVSGADGHGLYVGRADQDGVHVDSAGGYAGYFDGDVHVTGAATGFFPRPRWNSGWVTISRVEVKTLTHDVGGDPDDYFVDMQCRSSTWGITNTGVGGDTQSVAVEYGATYSALTSSSVKVYRRGDDDHCSQVRIRIWRIN